MRQIEALIEVIKQVKPDFKFYEDVGDKVIVGDLRSRIVSILADKIINGEVEYNKDHTDKKYIRGYTSSMVVSYLQRSRILNGNVPLARNKTKKPRITDAKLAALVKLRQTQVDLEILSEIDKYIKIRKGELRCQS